MCDVSHRSANKPANGNDLFQLAKMALPECLGKTYTNINFEMLKEDMEQRTFANSC